jgi:hypothetical protein
MVPSFMVEPDLRCMTVTKPLEPEWNEIKEEFRA